MKKFFLTLGFVFFSFPAAAQTVTQDDVKKSFDGLAALYNADVISHAKIYAYIEGMLTDDGVYKNATYIKGQPEPMTFSVNKEQLLNRMKENKEDYVDSTARYEIKSFENIGANAIVNYTLWQDATVNIEIPEKGKQAVSYSTVAECKDLYTFQNAVLKVLSSDCTVNLTPSTQPE